MRLQRQTERRLREADGGDVRDSYVDERPELEKAGLSDTRDIEQVFDSAEWTVLLAMAHYPFCQHGSDARQIEQLCHGGHVQIDKRPIIGFDRPRRSTGETHPLPAPRVGHHQRSGTPD